MSFAGFMELSCSFLFLSWEGFSQLAVKTG